MKNLKQPHEDVKAWRKMVCKQTRGEGKKWLTWRTETGNLDEGKEVSQRRNSTWISLRSDENRSMMRSMGVIHELARWQFCKQTQSPERLAWEIRVSAIGPCPWPRDIMWRRSPARLSCLSPNRCSIPDGSAPVERMNMMGVTLDESGNTSSSKRGLEPMYCLPSSLLMKSSQAKKSFFLADDFQQHWPLK